MLSRFESEKTSARARYNEGNNSEVEERGDKYMESKMIFVLLFYMRWYI